MIVAVASRGAGSMSNEPPPTITATPDQTFQRALAFHQSGRPQAADRLYRASSLPITGITTRCFIWACCAKTRQCRRGRRFDQAGAGGKPGFGRIPCKPCLRAAGIRTPRCGDRLLRAGVGPQSCLRRGEPRPRQHAPDAQATRRRSGRSR